MRRCGPQTGIPAPSLAQEPGDADTFAEEIGELATAAAELRQLEINAAQHGARLDRALAELVPEFSRSYLQQLLAQGLVQRNGQPALKAAARVHAATGYWWNCAPPSKARPSRRRHCRWTWSMKTPTCS